MLTCKNTLSRAHDRLRALTPPYYPTQTHTFTHVSQGTKNPNIFDFILPYNPKANMNQTLSLILLL